MSLAKVLIGVGVVGIIELRRPGTVEDVLNGVKMYLQTLPPVDVPLMPAATDGSKAHPLRQCEACGSWGIGQCSTCYMSNAANYVKELQLRGQVHKIPNELRSAKYGTSRGQLGARRGATGRAYGTKRGTTGRAYKNPRGGVLLLTETSGGASPVTPETGRPEARTNAKTAHVENAGRVGRGRQEGYRFALTLHRLEIYDAARADGMNDKAAQQFVIAQRIKESKEQRPKFSKNLVTKHNRKLEAIAVARAVKSHRKERRA